MQGAVGETEQTELYRPETGWMQGKCLRQSEPRACVRKGAAKDQGGSWLPPLMWQYQAY